LFRFNTVKQFTVVSASNVPL